MGQEYTDTKTKLGNFDQAVVRDELEEVSSALRRSSPLHATRANSLWGGGLIQNGQMLQGLLTQPPSTMPYLVLILVNT